MQRPRKEGVGRRRRRKRRRRIRRRRKEKEIMSGQLEKKGGHWGDRAQIWELWSSVFWGGMLAC